ncbi:hypothetical protein LQ327_29115 [Actinomycetospora endophytica]|uniref:Uncharacterized protein n=1 Tax=Actinomycetospora endophytica TaxID=2291215 RepID=A0ABS8PKD1_9PSEU|nr:hypothetical protein [Actinomycetospora endophytica]MCD2197439.1 hypothetical protein [Actinomycetospora endophytica]
MVEPSNAWDRAQQAIARAQQRNGTVVTPDNAESPFDASKTQMIPTPGYQNGSMNTHGRQPGRPPSPRPPADGRRPGPGQDPHRRGSHGRPNPSEPETTPVEVSDPTLMRPLSPVEPPTVRTAATRPRTAPFPAQGGSPAARPATPRPDSSPGPGPDDTPTTPPVGIRVPWWKRLFGLG